AADPLPAPVADPAFAETAAPYLAPPYPAPPAGWPEPPVAAASTGGKHAAPAAPLGDWPPDPAASAPASPGHAAPGSGTYGVAPVWPNTLAGRDAAGIVPGMGTVATPQAPGNGAGATATARITA